MNGYKYTRIYIFVVYFFSLRLCVFMWYFCFHLFRLIFYLHLACFFTFIFYSTKPVVHSQNVLGCHQSPMAKKWHKQFNKNQLITMTMTFLDSATCSIISMFNKLLLSFFYSHNYQYHFLFINKNKMFNAFFPASVISKHFAHQMNSQIYVN